MKKKKYEHPTMHVIEIKKHSPLLVASGNARVQDYDVETTTQEW